MGNYVREYNLYSMEHEIYKNKTLEEEDSLDLKAVQAIVNVFTEKKYESDRSKVLQGFRLIFSKCVPTLENKLLHGLGIEALFDVIASVDKEILVGNESEFEYIFFLLRLINYDKKFHDRVRVEFSKYIKIRLKKNETLPDFIINNIWSTLKKNSIIWPDFIEDITPSSIVLIENEVFGWLNASSGSYEMCNIKYYAEISAECKDLFQKITAMFNKILCLTQGNENIINLISYFVNLVSEYCKKNEKTIVRLYPREYYQLISLLVVPPEMYFGNKSQISKMDALKIEVLQLLLKKFKDDQSMILMLLTHYPKWLKEFFVYLSKINKDE